MCRLFGFRSDLPRAVHPALVTEKNSLRVQSREHKDGWGIAAYPEPSDIKPIVAHGLGPAHSDPDFERVSSQVSSHAVIAHVRLASVGEVHLRNAHPFLHEQWAFVHNGTLRDFARHQAAVEARIAPGLRELLRGETDSERCFYLFLTLLRELCGTVKADAPLHVRDVAFALAQTMKVVSSITDPGASEPSSMNFLVTDGHRMVATRRRRTLFFSTKDEKDQAHPELLAPHAPVAQFLVASERLWGAGPWHEVPEEGVVGVDDSLRLHQWTIPELLASR